MTAVAHATEVGCDDPVVLGQPGRDEVPPVRMGQKAMQQQHGRCAGRPGPFQVVQVYASRVAVARNTGLCAGALQEAVKALLQGIGQD